jgi:small subunit ribosomal protein S11
MAEEIEKVPDDDAAPVTPAAQSAESTSQLSDATGDDGDESAAHAQVARRDRRGKGAVPAGIAHIKSTFNNTSVVISDTRGDVISWCTGGRAGFKGSRKSTAFAATMVAQDAARQAVARGMHEVEVRVQGAGAGRESAIRALQSSGLNVVMIRDTTPIPHNGCRPRKRRRV